MKFFKKLSKKEQNVVSNSRDTAKERLHLVLMQDRANVSADFLELMKQEIIEVIKKYIDVDEEAIDVRLTNKENEDGTNGAPALYANIPIINIKNEARKAEAKVEEVKEELEKKQEKEKSDNAIEERETIKETKTDSKAREEKKKSKKTSKKEDKTEIIIDDGQKEKQDKQEKPAKEKEEELKSEN